MSLLAVAADPGSTQPPDRFAPRINHVGMLAVGVALGLVVFGRGLGDELSSPPVNLMLAGKPVPLLGLVPLVITVAALTAARWSGRRGWVVAAAALAVLAVTALVSGWAHLLAPPAVGVALGGALAVHGRSPVRGRPRQVMLLLIGMMLGPLAERGLGESSLAGDLAWNGGYARGPYLQTLVPFAVVLTVAIASLIRPAPVLVAGRRGGLLSAGLVGVTVVAVVVVALLNVFATSLSGEPRLIEFVPVVAAVAPAVIVSVIAYARRGPQLARWPIAGAGAGLAYAGGWVFLRELVPSFGPAPSAQAICLLGAVVLGVLCGGALGGRVPLEALGLVAVGVILLTAGSTGPTPVTGYGLSATTVLVIETLALFVLAAGAAGSWRRQVVPGVPGPAEAAVGLSLGLAMFLLAISIVHPVFGVFLTVLGRDTVTQASIALFALAAVSGLLFLLGLRAAPSPAGRLGVADAGGNARPWHTVVSARFRFTSTSRGRPGDQRERTEA